MFRLVGQPFEKRVGSRVMMARGHLRSKNMGACVPVQSEARGDESSPGEITDLIDFQACIESY